ncbi:Adenylate kinase 2, chloroplastic [Galdieria sulphuraria]|nr:Adenylate kinase 2, chloroplastic [Galdieria sulphuraria]
MGSIVKSAVESGERVPDKIVLQLVHKFLSAHDGYKKRVVFCGFPRTLTQIEFLRRHQFRIEQVFLIDTPDEGTMNGNGRVIELSESVYHRERIEQALRTPPRPFVLRKLTNAAQVENLREYIESGILFAESRMKPLWDSQWNGLMSMEMLRDGDFGISDIIYRWDLAILDMAIFYLYFYIQRHLLRVILERTAFYVSLAHSIPWVIISAFYGMYHIRSIESTSFMLRCIRMASKISLPLGIVVRGLRFSVGLHWFYILFTLFSLYYTLVTWRRAFISFDVFLGCPRRRKGYLVDIMLKLYRSIVLKRP